DRREDGRGARDVPEVGGLEKRRFGGPAGHERQMMCRRSERSGLAWISKPAPDVQLGGHDDVGLRGGTSSWKRTHGASVQTRDTGGGSVGLPRAWHVDDPGDRVSALQDAERDAPGGKASEKGRGAVDRIDHGTEAPGTGADGSLLGEHGGI